METMRATVAEKQETVDIVDLSEGLDIARNAIRALRKQRNEEQRSAESSIETTSDDESNLQAETSVNEPPKSERTPVQEEASKEVALTTAEKIDAASEHAGQINQNYISAHMVDNLFHRPLKISEFEAAEAEYASAWEEIEAESRGLSRDERAEAQAKAFFSEKFDFLDQTIEAKAGELYNDRSRELARMIREKTGRSDSADEEVIAGFYATVMEHVHAKSSISKGISIADWDRMCQSAHNNVIRQLNHMNAIARKYGVTPFTPRDFWTNEDYNNAPDPTKKRMLIDRYTVEEYYMLAFGGDLYPDENAREY